MPRELKSKTKQSARRGNNEGSIYQRKDERWCSQVLVGYQADGKPLRRYVYGNTRAEVARQLAAQTKEVFENGYVTVAPKAHQWFREIFEEWFVTFREPNMSSSTASKLRNLMKNHIYITFGKMELADVDLLKLQKFFNNEAKKGLSLQTIKHMKQLMNQFYKYAVKEQMVKHNPIDEVKIKTIERRDDKREQMALTEEQRERVFTALENEVLLKPIIITFAFTGLRPGELIALQWKNVDLENATMSIRHSTQRNIEFDADGNAIHQSLSLSNTKTLRSTRTFIIPEVVKQTLLEWRERQEYMGVELGVDYTSNEQFVFCSKKGEMRTYHSLRSLLARFKKRHGFVKEKFNLYTFRHTFATMLLEARENPEIVARLMGHSKVTTTLLVYSHVVSQDVYEQTAKTLDSAFSKISAKKEKNQ